MSILNYDSASQIIIFLENLIKANHGGWRRDICLITVQKHLLYKKTAFPIKYLHLWPSKNSSLFDSAQRANICIDNQILKTPGRRVSREMKKDTALQYPIGHLIFAVLPGARSKNFIGHLIFAVLPSGIKTVELTALSCFHKPKYFCAYLFLTF